jgi:WD40 repeat protein
MAGSSRKIVVVLLTLAWSTALEAAPAPSIRAINALSPQLHRLDPKHIRGAECRPWHPVELVAIVGHQRGRHWHNIGSISYSPDGKQIATVARDHHSRGVYLWETAPLRFLAVLPIRASFIRFLPNENILLTCSEDGTASLWDVSEAKPKQRKLFRASLGAFMYGGTIASPDGKRLLTRTNSTVDLYDLRASPPRRTILPATDGLTLESAAFSPDSRTLATLTSKRHYSRAWPLGPYTITNLKVTLWDVSVPQPKQRCLLDGTCGEWDELTFSPDGKILLVGSNLWDLSKAIPKFRTSLLGTEEKNHQYVFNPDGSRTVWNHWGELKRHYRICVFTPDGRYTIVSSIEDDRSHISVCDLRPRVPRIIQSVQLTSEYLSPMAIASDGKSLAVGEQNCLHVWPIKDGKIEVSSPTYGHLSDVTALSFGACGNLLATASKDATLRLWDLDGSRPHQRLVRKGDLHPWGRHSNPWDSIALSADGTKLATASLKQGVTIWNVSPSGLRVLAEHKYSVAAPPDNLWCVPPPPPIALTFTPDSKSLFVAHGTDPIKIIDLAKPSAIAAELKTAQGVAYCNVAASVPVGRPLVIPPEAETIQIRDPLYVYTLAVSPDGKTLALGASHEIEIWQRIDKGWSRRIGFCHLEHCVHSMAFARSGNTLIVGSRCGNGAVRRFDLSGEKPVQLSEPVVHDKPITSVAASPNGKFLAAADEGGHVVVWSAGMAKKLHEWTFPGPVRCVSFAPDGRHLALGNGDGTVYILRLALPTEK